MANLIKLKVDEADIWIEADEDVFEKGIRRVSSSESMEKATISFEEISNTIKAYCTSLVKAIKGFDNELTPNTLKAEFGLRLSGEGNVYVVKTAT